MTEAPSALDVGQTFPLGTPAQRAFKPASVELFDLGFAVDEYVLEGDHLLFTVREFRQGNTDLNGDGDMSDAVLHHHHLSQG